ncbi:replication endonuclease [Photobacterium kishitanii]|uniref:replication endonuclease n=1 Tax=Photobacterium kishitanii TaxID=318456 RepID=UPI000D15D816|nr:replication endonuclease [Photobacterium kishitanii]PSV16537.1 replication endonuclease [Photobacterium kishitanii]
MKRILVHDLATDQFEYVNFLHAQTLCSSFTKPDINNGRKLPGYVDHTRPNNSYVADLLKRQALATPIHSFDTSDNIQPSFAAPCLDILNLVRPHRAFAPVMSRAYINLKKKIGELDAMRSLVAANERLTKNEFRYTFSDDQLVTFAKAKSHTVMKAVAVIEDDAQAFQVASSILADYGLYFSDDVIKAKSENNELRSLVNRATNELWWRRALRKLSAIEVERVARDLAIVHKYGQAYCSNYSVSRRRERDTDNKAILENTVAYDEVNEDNWFTLSDLADKSVSNPVVRRAEMFVRLKGFEAIAQDNDHVAMFYTLTCPSRFHSVSKSHVNQAWLDAGKPTTQDAQAYLSAVFAGFRKALDKAGIKIYGLRVAEPHADGCPHWHLLMFMDKTQHSDVTNLFKNYALQDSPEEKGAQKHRFTVETIDWSKGSAVGYVAKYLSKNIDGKHIDNDVSSDLTGVEASERVVTWARVNRIRQFQFIGGPSVTVWREMRRVRDEIKEDDPLIASLSTGEHMALENVRRAADASDWQAFCYAMGGVFVRRKDQTVSPVYSIPQIMSKLVDEWGEEHTTERNATTRYGDAAIARVVGVLFRGAFLATRVRNWKTENKEKFLRGTKRIMSGVVDVFDVLERENEYHRLADAQFNEYQQYLQRVDEITAFAFDEAAWPSFVGAAHDGGLSASSLDLCQ